MTGIMLDINGGLFFIFTVLGLVMTVTVCELENGPVDSSLIYPLIAWWIFPWLCSSLPEGILQ